MSFLRAQGPRSRHVRLVGIVESLEIRDLLAAVSVDIGQVVRAVNPQLLGVNAVWWDTNLNTTQTEQMVEAAGLNLFRLPGGSSSDDFHFNAPPSYQGEGTIPSMASFVASVNGQAVVTLDYGSGSPQEAAAELAYLNAPVGATTPIGDGQEWNDSTSSWQTVNWQNAGYWASLRAAQPLAVDDGLNFLRLGRAAPFDFADFEIGNEEYGSWEIDHHTAQHDPATYVAFAKQFETYAASIDPSISIGIDAGSPDNSYNNWLPDVLQQSVTQGFTIGFISDHNYVQAPGSESDATLLLDTVSNPSSPYDWAVRATDYTDLLDQYLGAAGQNVALLTTEFNSVYSNPGKQTTSLVNGLFIADSLGELLQTSYQGATVWDLRNGYDTSNNNASSLYGWRDGGDYGLIGSPGTAPNTGTYVPYPSYFAEQLASEIIQAGGNVVQATSDDPNLAVYAVHESNGNLELLVINKSPSGPITGQFSLADFHAAAQAQLWQYGETQDTAQSESATGASALASFTATLPLSGSGFSYAFPAYSMTVVDLSPDASYAGPTITSAAASAANPVKGTSTGLSVTATDPAGASALTYTWSAISPSPAGVVFSVNGTNGASQTTATFTQAGTYTFSVIVTDPSGLTASSDVTVNVAQTLTSITVSPAMVTVVAGATQMFTAEVDDQFGNLALLPGVGYTWSLVSGIGAINPFTGLYTAPGEAGSAIVKASLAGIAGTASVTVAPPDQGTGLSATIHYTDSADWRTGFVGDVMITNTGSSPIDAWTLQFNFAPKITAIWGAAIAKHSGNQYTIDGTSSDTTIAPGQSVSFGFQGKPGRHPTGPSSIRLNGVALPLSPSAGALSARATFAVTSQSKSGFGATITITNMGTVPIGGWALQFNFTPRITSVTNAAIVRRAGLVYVIRDAGYDGVIAPDASVSFQLRGSQRKLRSGPVKYWLDGMPISGITL
jgi:alpha-L-arabinofuranosidase